MTLLFPTPVVYDGNDSRFLQRDGARFALALATTENRGIKVILKERLHLSPSCPPLLRAGTWNQWIDPSFWRSFKAEGALCYFGLGAKRFQPVVEAMKRAGIKTALKMDSALGMNRFPRYFSTSLGKAYWFFRQSVDPLRSFLAATTRAFVPAIRPMTSETIRYFESFDVVTAESPLARDNTRRWLHQSGRSDLAQRVVLLHHPVPDSFVPPETKSDRILAVAQDWSNPLKGGAILQKAFALFLSRHPNWRATIVGNASNRFSKLQTIFGNQVDLRPKLMAEELLPIYQDTKILCIASGSEGSPNVVFESLACGCSVVFPPSIPQLEWIVRAQIGSAASSRTPSGLFDALDRECLIWANTPNRIKAIQSSTPPLHVHECLDILLRLFFSHSTIQFTN